MGQTQESPEVVIITGLSGAGRSTAANAIEDLGYSVIDNMPPPLITQVVSLVFRGADQTDAPDGSPSGGAPAKLAFGCDARDPIFFPELETTLDQLAERGISVKMLYCEATDEILLRRFDESRRPHPHAGDAGIIAGVRRERALLAGLRERADLIIDTSTLNVHALRDLVTSYFADAGVGRELHVAVQSFGFKNGIPRDADMVLDVRFLPNPHWIDKLRPLPGTSDAVREYVLGLPETAEFVDRVYGLVDFLIPRYVAEGKSYFTIAIGCTGGKHRSVALAHDLVEHIRRSGVKANIVDRDLAAALARSQPERAAGAM